MVTWVPGHSVCTASASTCAASWRISSSARGSSRSRNSILASLLDRIGEVGDRAVERHRDRALGERGRDALGDVETGDVVGILPTRAVGKGQGDHRLLLLLTRCLRTQVSAAQEIMQPPASGNRPDRTCGAAVAGEATGSQRVVGSRLILFWYFWLHAAGRRGADNPRTQGPAEDRTGRGSQVHASGHRFARSLDVPGRDRNGGRGAGAAGAGDQGAGHASHRRHRWCSTSPRASPAPADRAARSGSRPRASSIPTPSRDCGSCCARSAMIASCRCISSRTAAR